jgi:hypothetical protein
MIKLLECFHVAFWGGETEVDYGESFWGFFGIEICLGVVRGIVKYF